MERLGAGECGNTEPKNGVICARDKLLTFMIRGAAPDDHRTVLPDRPVSCRGRHAGMFPSPRSMAQRVPSRGPWQAFRYSSSSSSKLQGKETGKSGEITRQKDTG